jgi:hypothetical protein
MFCRENEKMNWHSAYHQLLAAVALLLLLGPTKTARSDSTSVLLLLTARGAAPASGQQRELPGQTGQVSCCF